MGFFSELGAKAYAPVNAGFGALIDAVRDPAPSGVLTKAIAEEDKNKAMPSITDLGMQAMQPGFSPQPGAMGALGQRAMQGDPVFTDSSKTLMFNEDDEKKKKKFDLQELGKTLQSIKAPKEARSSGGNISTGRVGGGFRFDPSLYEDPLVKREYQNLYMAPLYQDLMNK